MTDELQKVFVRITKDHFWRNPFCFEEFGTVVVGSEGLIIDMPMIKLLPNLSEEERCSILSWHFLAKDQAAYLVLINGHLVQVSVSDYEIVRYDPPLPIFEDEEDHRQYVDEKIKKMMKPYSENNNAGA